MGCSKHKSKPAHFLGKLQSLDGSLKKSACVQTCREPSGSASSLLSTRQSVCHRNDVPRHCQVWTLGKGFVGKLITSESLGETKKELFIEQRFVHLGLSASLVVLSTPDCCCVSLGTSVSSFSWHLLNGHLLSIWGWANSYDGVVRRDISQEYLK